MRTIIPEIEEFKTLCEQTNYFEGFEMNQIGTELANKHGYPKDKVRRFGIFFILKGLTDGWLLDEFWF